MRSSRLFRKTLLLLPLAAGLAFATSEYLRQVPLDTVGPRQLTVDLQKADSVRLIVIGDVGARLEEQRSTALLMEKLCLDYDPIGVLFLGDNFSNAGVTGTADEQWNSQFEEMYGGPCLSRVPFYAILGNHDYKGDPGAQIRYTGMGSARWHMPSRAYSVRFGDLLHVLAVDTNFPDKCYFASLCSLDWLEAEAKRIDSRWTLVMGHAPIRSGGKYQQLKVYQEWVLPNFLCRVNPDFYFSGHDHNFQHILSTVPGRSDCPLNHFTVGTGGAPLVPTTTLDGQTRFSRTTLGASVLQMTEEKMRLDFFEADSAERLYFYEQTKPPSSS